MRKPKKRVARSSATHAPGIQNRERPPTWPLRGHAEGDQMKRVLVGLVRIMLAATMFVPLMPTSARGQTTVGQPAAKSPAPIRRRADGKPDLQGYYMPDAGGANYGLERHDVD